MSLRWVTVAAWFAAAAALIAFAPREPQGEEPESFLPDDAPVRRAQALLRQAFPQRSGLSEAAVVFERHGRALDTDDLGAIERFADRLRAQAGAEREGGTLAGVTVRSPASVAVPKIPLVGLDTVPNPLVSPASDRGQAALVVVSVPSNFITRRSDRVVKHVREMLARLRDDEQLPAGLDVAVTGPSGYGSDYALAANRSHEQTFRVTVVAVLVILLLVHRAPLAALVPLTAISLAAVAALKLLNILTLFGMQFGTAEIIFVVVLLYGAGTDYSLLLISRYREQLDAGAPGAQAVAEAIDATLPAILASAGTDAAGLLTLVFASFGIFRTTGPAVALALTIAFLASVTLVPAFLSLLGPRVFWPGRRGQRPARVSRFWPKLAGAVTARPGVVFVATLALLAVPAIRAVKLPWVYDTLASLKSSYGAARGAEMARRHWPIGEIAPVVVIAHSDATLDAPAWRELSDRLTRAASSAAGVTNVRSLTQPFGKGVSPAANAAVAAFASGKVNGEYLSADRRTMRLQAVLDGPPLTLESMDAVRRIAQAARDALPASQAKHVTIQLAGATAEILDVREVTQRDFYLVAALSLAIILSIVLALLRDVILTTFMVASTALSYLAALGVAYWVFAGWLGEPGLDWKVEVFLFVVMIAVGVDYNIFLAARLGQEAAGGDKLRAVRQAVIHTGPVISSCGIIMAATLGSLMAGDLKLLQQLGFAFAVGMLIDTFVVRPLLLPAFIAMTGRIGRVSGLSH
ncbi:MAG TPA: MMPL family transporter [Phycisphaerae bacterium]|nr:MMPL family transporter [Phycisphaerae bacterium]